MQRRGVDLSEYDHAFPSEQDYFTVELSIGMHENPKAANQIGMAEAIHKPWTGYCYVVHGLDPVVQADRYLSLSNYFGAPSLKVDIEGATTGDEGRAFIARLRLSHGKVRPIIRYSPLGIAQRDGNIGQDYDWTALWGSNGNPPPPVAGIPVVEWQDWSSDSGYPRPLHAPPHGDSDLWLGTDDQFAKVFGLTAAPVGGTEVRFVQAYEAEKNIDVPVGTMLYTFDGAPLEPLHGSKDQVTLRTRGLADAHANQFVVLVTTGGVYSDSGGRLTELIVKGNFTPY